MHFLGSKSRCLDVYDAASILNAYTTDYCCIDIYKIYFPSLQESVFIFKSNKDNTYITYLGHIRLLVVVFNRLIW